MCKAEIVHRWKEDLSAGLVDLLHASHCLCVWGGHMALVCTSHSDLLLWKASGIESKHHLRARRYTVSGNVARGCNDLEKPTEVAIALDLY